MNRLAVASRNSEMADRPTNGASNIQNQCFPVAVGTQLTISNCLTNLKIMKCKVLTKWAQQTKLLLPVFGHIHFIAKYVHSATANRN